MYCSIDAQKRLRHSWDHQVFGRLLMRIPQPYVCFSIHFQFPLADPILPIGLSHPCYYGLKPDFPPKVSFVAEAYDCGQVCSRWIYCVQLHLNRLDEPEERNCQQPWPNCRSRLIRYEVHPLKTITEHLCASLIRVGAPKVATGGANLL